jgi:hypothetical protein
MAGVVGTLVKKPLKLSLSSPVGARIFDRALGVGRTGIAHAVTCLCQVADAGRGPAGGAVREELAARRAARSGGPVQAASQVALLAARALHHAVAAQGHQRYGDEVAVVRLRAAADAGILTGGLAAVGDRQAQPDGALVAAGEEAVAAAAAGAPGEAERVGDRGAVAGALDVRTPGCSTGC